MRSVIYSAITVQIFCKLLTRLRSYFVGNFPPQRLLLREIEAKYQVLHHVYFRVSSCPVNPIKSYIFGIVL